MLAALAADPGEWTPVQVQKMFFLLEQRAAHVVGRHWSFKPYDYGPFDAGVYRELERLGERGLVVISPDGQGSRRYRLTEPGRAEGARVLASLAPSTAEYIGRLAAWVRSLSFAQLVSAIYRDFPEMKVNSVFNG